MFDVKCWRRSDKEVYNKSRDFGGQTSCTQ
jgi:hypothetical protein